MFFSCSDTGKNNEQAESDKQEAENRNDAKFSKDAEDDAQFVVDAANMNLIEMSLGSIASRSGTIKEVKELGNVMNTTQKTPFQFLLQLESLRLKTQQISLCRKVMILMKNM